MDYFLIDADGNPVEAGGPARADTLYGTAGNDHILSGGGNLMLDLGAGDDHLYNNATAGTVNVSSGAGRDYAAGGPRCAVMFGRERSRAVNDAYYHDTEQTEKKAA